MRRSKLKAAEIEAQELADNQRKQNRRNGMSLMPERDQGWGKLSNGQVIEWPVDAPLQELVPRRVIPNGQVVIDEIFYDVDELRRYLRWA